MNRLVRKLTLFVLVFVALVSSVSCEMEIPEYTPADFVKSADSSVWEKEAKDETETKGKGLSKSELDDGTGYERFREIELKLNLEKFEGYDLVFLDFNIVSNNDVALTIECFQSDERDGERVPYGTQEVELKAEEATSISLDLDYKVENVKDEPYLFITFTTDLPFYVEAETTEGEEAAELPLCVSDVEYEISALRLYGVQTTAS